MKNSSHRSRSVFPSEPPEKPVELVKCKSLPVLPQSLRQYYHISWLGRTPVCDTLYLPPAFYQIVVEQVVIWLVPPWLVDVWDPLSVSCFHRYFSPSSLLEPQLRGRSFGFRLVFVPFQASLHILNYADVLNKLQGAGPPERAIVQEEVDCSLIAIATGYLQRRLF